MNIPPSIFTMLAGIALTLASLWYGQNHGLLPTPASEEAPLVDGLFNAMMTVGTGIFLLVQGILILVAFRYRRKPGDTTDGPPVHGNIPLEILWTAIPAVLILGIAVYSFDVYQSIGGSDPMAHGSAHAGHKHGSAEMQMAQMPGAAIAGTLDSSLALADGNTNQAIQDEITQDPATATVRNTDIPQRQNSPEMGVTAPGVGATPVKTGQPEFEVNVTGLQFAWIFTYPDSGVVSGELRLPVGREVKLNISANDVIHAFWVPEFRLKQDAVPGLQTQMHFKPVDVGEYPVICAELCGAYHGAMKTRVIVQTPAEFDAWIASQRVAQAELDPSALALSPQDKTPDQFLAPYAQDLGINADLLRQIPVATNPHPATEG